MKSIYTTSLMTIQSVILVGIGIYADNSIIFIIGIVFLVLAFIATFGQLGLKK